MAVLTISGSSSTPRLFVKAEDPRSIVFHTSTPVAKTQSHPGTPLIPCWEYIVLTNLDHLTYELSEAIVVEVEYTSDVIIARYNPVDMYGAGQTREESIRDLADALVEYYECLESAGEVHLGPMPKQHFKRLSRLIHRRS